MSIEHRKVSKPVTFVDAAGNALANQTISLEQTNHKFLFGCGAFVSMPYVLGFDKKNNEFHKKATEEWLDLFNYGTLPFYWGNFEREEGKPDTEALMKCAKYLKERNVTIKGHPLCWHTVCADWLMKYDNQTILKKQLDRIEREVGDFKGVIDYWDVINEVVIMPIFDKYDNAVTRLCNEYGQVGLVKMVFDKAREVNPNATLLINDFNTSPQYEDLIDRCLDAGVSISAIGIQSHQHQGYWGAEKTYDVLERFSRFNLPIHFTENTLISGDIMPAYIEDLNDWQVDEWPSTPEGEARQAKEMEEMYRILFENPKVEAITAWDFRDGAWLNAPSGIVRLDNSPKSAYDMLQNLIHKEWSTNKSFTTDSEGCVTIDAFKGDYKITANGKSVNASLTDNETVSITIA